jgi:hypothetical protein
LGGRSRDTPDDARVKERIVVLLDTRGSSGSQHETARRTPEGGVLIEGQDLGSGVAMAFGAGNTEYEWSYRIAPSDVPAAAAALGGQPGDDLLDVMGHWASTGRGPELARVLRQAGVPMEFWSRVGN